MFPSKKLTIVRNIRRGLAVLLIVLFSGVIGLVSPAHAAIICQQMTEVAKEKPQIRSLALSDEQIVWRTKKAIRRYDIAAQTVHTIAEKISSQKYEYFIEVNGDHIIWTDADYRVYLHTISTGQTIKISRGAVTSHLPLIDDGYIVYARSSKNSEYDGPFRLMVYDIATGLTVRVTASAYSGWGLDAGRVVYHDQAQVYLYDIASDLNEVITTRETVYSAAIDDQFIVYEADIPKSSSGFDWLSREVFLYDLGTQEVKQVTDSGYRTRIYGVWIDAASNVVIWGELRGLSEEGWTFFYDILTGTVSGGDDNITDYFDIAPLEIDGRFVGAYDYYYDPDQDWDFYSAAVYDRLSETVLPLVADGYNSGHSTQLAGGRAAWVAEQVEMIDYDGVVTQRAVYLSANCAATPYIHEQSESGDVISGRPKALFVEAKGDLPLSYQWYRGEAGDTSMPVGENSPAYITPDLMTLVSYWVRVSNLIGSTDSETITLSPAPSYQLVGNEGFEKPLNKKGGFWDDFWIDRDFPKTQRVCNTPDNLIAFEGECAYRFGKPDKDAIHELHYIDQEMTWRLPQVEAGDVLTVTAYVNSINVSDAPYLTLEVWYDDQPDSVLTLEGDPNAVGYTLMTGMLALTSENFWNVEITIGYPGKRGRVFFDVVTVTASAGDSAPVLVPLPDAPGDLRKSNP